MVFFIPLRVVAEESGAAVRGRRWSSGDRSDRRCGRCGATGSTAPTALIESRVVMTLRRALSPTFPAGEMVFFIPWRGVAEESGAAHFVARPARAGAAAAFVLVIFRF